MAVLNEAVGHLKTLAENGTSTAFLGVSQRDYAIMENGKGNKLSTFQKKEYVALPSKMQLAVEWFKEHPEDIKRSGRELSISVLPKGVQISHKYWNDAKRQLSAENIEEHE